MSHLYRWFRDQLFLRRWGKFYASPRCDRNLCNVPMVWWDDIPCTDERSHTYFYKTGYIATHHPLDSEHMKGTQ